jgi:hypothetical protein
LKGILEDNPDAKFDAVIAASSLHWALAVDDQANMICKLQSSLKEKTILILFWNFPPEPSDPNVFDQVADAIGETDQPFHFANDAVTDHKARQGERVLTPLKDSKLFIPLKTYEELVEEELSISHFLSYLKTLGNATEDQDRLICNSGGNLAT